MHSEAAAVWHAMTAEPFREENKIHSIRSKSPAIEGRQILCCVCITPVMW